MNEYNKEALENTIKEMDRIQAKFYMDNFGNEICNVLNETQVKLRDIYNTYYGIEEWIKLVFDEEWRECIYYGKIQSYN